MLTPDKSDLECDAMPIVRKLKGIRILLVAPSLRIMGGQAVQADLLLRHLRAEGVDVDLLPINPMPWGPFGLLTRIKYVRTVVVSLIYVITLLQRVRRYDVVHIFSASYFSFILAPTPALLISKLYRKKTLLNYHSGEAEDHLQSWGRTVFWIFRLADALVVPSEYLVEVFKRFGFTAGSVLNVTDLETFQYRERTTLIPRLLITRNLEPLYDVETSLRAFSVIKKKHASASLTVVGSGADARRLMDLVRDLGLSDITFTGRVERAEMPSLYECSNIFLNSSVIDNMPVAILEAYSAGLPVVTTDAGGIPYIVRNGESGLVVPKRDVAALATALERVITDAELRSRIVAGGRAFVEQCRWEVIRDNWARVYRELVDGR